MCTKFVMVVGVADVITCDKYFSYRLRVVDSVGRGAKIVLSHWQSQSPLTLGWRCRAACDFQPHLMFGVMLHYLQYLVKLGN